MSYASRNKYLSTNDKIYSTIMQETQAEMALNEVEESIFQYHLQPDQNMQEKEVGASIHDRTISPTNKVVLFQTPLGQTTKPKKGYSLGFVFSGNCVEIHKEIKKIFNEEMEKSCKTSPAFFSLLPELCVWCSIPQRKKSSEQSPKQN